MQSTWEEIYCCVPAVSSFDSRLTHSTTPWSSPDHPPECTEGTRRASNPIRSQIGTQTQVSEIDYFCAPSTVAPRLPNNQCTPLLASSDKRVRDAMSGLAVPTAEQKLCDTQTLSSQNANGNIYLVLQLLVQQRVHATNGPRQSVMEEAKGYTMAHRG